MSQAFGQTATGTVRGVVTDNSGAVVPAATVTLTGPGVERSAQTQADGSYVFQGLAPGQFTVKMTYPGFAAFEKSVAVSGAGMAQVPIQLVLSTEKQEVTVAEESGPAISVEPDNNATALVLKGDDLEALPDDPDDLSDALQALAGPGAGPNGGSLYIDGFTGGQLPPKESIREIRINQNPFSAEYDRLGFGRIEILTKPGTDKFRGNVHYNDGESAFNSRNPFATNKPTFFNRQVGANFGGPLGKKASFFIDFNRRDVQNNAVSVAQYLSPTSLALTPAGTATIVPLANTFIAPRFDYQISTNNTLTVRFEERWNNQQNNGLGGFNLPPGYAGSELAYPTISNGQNLTATETAVLSPTMVNETRFQYTRNWNANPGNLVPELNVASEFITGGNGLGNSYDLTHHFELQNYTSITKGTHTIRFGGRFRRNSDLNNSPQGFNGQFLFTGGNEPVLDASDQPTGETAALTALQQYQRYLQLQAAGLSAATVQSLGGGPSQFLIQTGEPYVSMTRWDVGPFIQDDWRMRPNLTVSMGLRYEWQNLMSDHSDWAPRLGIAWAPGNPRNGRSKTVIRGGAGIFYDRTNFVPFEKAFLNNGVRQLQYTVYNPTFNYPLAALVGGQQVPTLSVSNNALYEGGVAVEQLGTGQNNTWFVDPKLKAESDIQAAIGIERQLPRRSVLSINYTYTRSNHLLQQVPINTPLPGTYNPSPSLTKGPNNGVYPYGYAAGDLFEYESGGFLKQHMVMFNLNTQFSRRISMFVNYTLNFAKDLPTIPTDPYDFMLDYGRSNLDRRNNVQIVGSALAPFGLHFAPFVTIRSGAPYDVLLGEDIFGDTEFNARAAFAPAGAACGGTVKCTPYGNFVTNVNPASLTNLVPRNYLTMAGMFSINLRVYRVFGFGRSVRGNRAANNRGGGQQGGPGGFNGPPGGGFGGGGGGRGGGGFRGGGGGGRGGFGGGETTDHRFNLTVGVQATNILNHFNPGGYQSDLASTLFGQPTTVNTGFGGGGFVGGAAQAGSVANNRRIELQTRLTF